MEKKRNLWVIPTDKPSRLHIAKNGDYHYSYENVLHLVSANDKPHNTYITSDEEIKEGEYCITKTNEVIKFKKSYTQCFLYKKIILTTDQDLIAYGVEEISEDELLKIIKDLNNV
jgi:hypothetical protein